jgi:hypothetical protein
MRTATQRLPELGVYFDYCCMASSLLVRNQCVPRIASNVKSLAYATIAELETFISRHTAGYALTGHSLQKFVLSMCDVRFLHRHISAEQRKFQFEKDVVVTFQEKLYNVLALKGCSASIVCLAYVYVLKLIYN